MVSTIRIQYKVVHGELSARWRKPDKDEDGFSFDSFGAYLLELQ